MKLFLPKYPSLLRLLYLERISRVDNSKAIYLTFDDGPVPEVTLWVLEQLAEFNAKATFFCIGENVKKHPDIFQRILEEGHLVGNHTYNHLNGWKTSNSDYIDNTLKAEEIFKSQVASEEHLQLFRPPYGRIKNSQARLLKKNGYKIVMWDVISGDYEKAFSGEKCYKNVIEYSSAGSTIVFHDSKKALNNLKIILPKILEYYRDKGLEFRSLKDAL